MSSQHDCCSHMTRFLHDEAEAKTPWLISKYVQAHVARCTPCRKTLESLRRLLTGLKEFRQTPIPDDAKDRLMNGKWRGALTDDADTKGN